MRMAQKRGVYPSYYRGSWGSQPWAVKEWELWPWKERDSTARPNENNDPPRGRSRAKKPSGGQRRPGLLPRRISRNLARQLERKRAT